MTKLVNQQNVETLPNIVQLLIYNFHFKSYRRTKAYSDNYRGRDSFE